MIVKDQDIVKVHYTGKYEDGEIFDSSRDEEPLIFQTGVGMMIPGFDKALIGMKVGESKQITVGPEEGYGDYMDDRVIEMGLDSFPEGHTPEIGMEMELVDSNRHAIPAIVKEIKEETIVLDANHPLAGKTVSFDIELLEIGCELPEHYAAHGCGCGCGSEKKNDCAPDDEDCNKNKGLCGC